MIKLLKLAILVFKYDNRQLGKNKQKQTVTWFSFFLSFALGSPTLSVYSKNQKHFYQADNLDRPTCLWIQHISRPYVVMTHRLYIFIFLKRGHHSFGFVGQFITIRFFIFSKVPWLNAHLNQCQLLCIMCKTTSLKWGKLPTFISPCVNSVFFHIRAAQYYALLSVCHLATQVPGRKLSLIKNCVTKYVSWNEKQENIRK